MTGSASDPPAYRPHVRSKGQRKALAERFKDPEDRFKLVIARDMWLTGFDAPSLHTMYVDKPMHGHGLMQAIARVNRVYKDKSGGLIVDHLGIATDLQQAMKAYTEAGSGQPAFNIERAITVMLDACSVVKSMFHGFHYAAFFRGEQADRVQVIPKAMGHILTLAGGSNDENKKRFMDGVTRLSQAFALCVPDESALWIRDDVGFFRAIRAQFAKSTPVDARTKEDLDGAIKQLVSQAVSWRRIPRGR